MIWGTAVFGAALTALALLNEQLHWLSPLQFAALAIAVLLIVIAPRPAWVALVIAGVAAYAVRSAAMLVDFDHHEDFCLNSIGICGDQLYNPGDAEYFLELPMVPAVLVVIGVLGWAIRRRSWRTAVAGAAYGVAVETMAYEAPIVLFAAAAAALGPRKDVRYLAGVGILALVLANQYREWTLLVTIIVITAALALVVWALVEKDGVNGAVALVALASAALAPLLSAGVLLAASLIKRRAWLGLAAAATAVGLAVFTAPGEVQSGFTTLRGVEMSARWVEAEPAEPSSWLIMPGLLLAAAVMATVAALVEHRHRVTTDQANG